MSKIAINFVTPEAQEETKRVQQENESLLPQINSLQSKINKLNGKINDILEKNTELIEKCEQITVEKLEKNKEILEIKNKISEIEKQKDSELKETAQKLKEKEDKLKDIQAKIQALKSIINEESATASCSATQKTATPSSAVAPQSQPGPKKLSNIIKIVVISNFPVTDERSKDLHENLQNLTRLGFNIEIFDFFCFADQNAQAVLKTKSATAWKDNNVECFFMFTAGAAFPIWLGDFLYDMHLAGLGVVLCKNCTNNDSNGVAGKFDDVLPIIKGPSKKDDGPLPLALKMGPQQPCYGDDAGAASYDLVRDISTFDGGKYANRSEIKPKKAKENEIIDLFASWGDQKHTPLIVTKRYIGAEKSGWGRIVVLNFWPISSELNPVNWEVRKDGVKILQYFVIWASKRLESLIIKKQESQPPTAQLETPDISAMVEQEIKKKLGKMFEKLDL